MDAVPSNHRGSAVVTEILHTLRERHEVLRDLVAVASVEHLCMVGITPRLDGGQRGIGILRCGEVLVKDRATCKEIGDFRHAFWKMRAYDWP